MNKGIGTTLFTILDTKQIKTIFQKLREAVYNDVKDDEIGDLIYIKDFIIKEINQKDIVIDVEIRGKEKNQKKIVKKCFKTDVTQWVQNHQVHIDIEYIGEFYRFQL